MLRFCVRFPPKCCIKSLFFCFIYSYFVNVECNMKKYNRGVLKVILHRLI